jgi:hypothetical protein
MKQCSIAAFLLVLNSLPFQSTAALIFVNHAATGQNAGTSWQDAYNDLQSALTASQAGDSIWVAEGTYFPTSGTDRNASFVLKSKVQLYGGFAGTETDLSQRDWTQHTTTLSGDIGMPGDTSDNAYTILYMKNADVGTVINGFRFEYGIADDPTFTANQLIPSKCGGAIFIQAVGGIGYPDIINCTFYHNYAVVNGGAVFVSGDVTGSVAPRFIHCIFDENRSQFNGSAVDRYGGSKRERFPDFSLCTFTHNTSFNNSSTVLWSDGPGIDTMQFDHCVFDHNNGGIFIEPGRTSGLKLSLKQCSFLHGKGSGLYVTASGGTETEWVDFIKISNCTFNFNTIQVQPVIKVDVIYAPIGKKSRVWIDQTNCRFNQVSGFQYGLIVLYGVDTSVISNCTFEYNKLHGLCSAENFTGDLFILNSIIAHNSNPTIERGGLGPISVRLINTRYEGNSFIQADYFSGLIAATSFQNCLFARDTVSGPGGGNVSQSISLRNCAFWKNKYPVTPLFRNWTGAVTFNHCYFDALNTGNLPSNISLSPNTLIGTPPLFVADNPTQGDYHLQPCSPLIDAGNNTGLSTVQTDLDGNPRIQNMYPDIGPYEASAPILTGNTTVISDCTGQHTGSVTFYPAYGCGPYTYTWQAGTTTGTGNTNLAAGSYRFTITDTHGNELQQAVTIGGPPVLTPSPQPVDCLNGTGGIAIVLVDGGVAPYQYAWGQGGTGETLSGLQPGTYLVTVTDAGGCMDSTTVTIVLQDTLPFSGSTTHISCFGAQDGTIELTPGGGQSPYGFIWSDGLMGPMHANCGPGAYSVTVSDFFGCTGAATYTFEQPDTLHNSVTIQNATGPQTPDGSIRIIGLSGGSPPYGIKWSSGMGSILNDHLLPGTYSFTITDENGCTKTGQAVVGFTSQTTEAADIALVRVYPNPAQEQLNIEFGVNQDGPVELRVYSITGVLISHYEASGLSKGGNLFVLPVTAFEEGIYILEARNHHSLTKQYFTVIH